MRMMVSLLACHLIVAVTKVHHEKLLQVDLAALYGFEYRVCME